MSVHIPGYQIQSKIDVSGMASVYLAVQENLRREVVLKVMSPTLSTDVQLGARFQREARIVAQMRHQHIVATHDVGKHSEFVMSD